jgi:hypothetical protein
MAHNPELRASDEDRDAAAALLREHHAVGRLDAQEFSDRLDQTFAAKTVGDIEGLLRDLPRIDLYRLAGAKLNRQPNQARRPPRTGRMPAAWRAAWGVYATVNVLCLVIWVLSGFGYPWFLWVAGPWGVVMAGSYATVSTGRASRRELGSAGPSRELPGRQDPGNGPLGP